MNKFDRCKNYYLNESDVGLPDNGNKHSKEYLLNRINELKRSLHAAIDLIVEYTNLPYDAKNGNVVHGVDEGEKLTNDLLKEILSNSDFDKDLIELIRFYNNKSKRLDRLINYEKFIRKVANSGVSVHSAWGWIEVEARRALDGEDIDDE